MITWSALAPQKVSEQKCVYAGEVGWGFNYIGAASRMLRRQEKQMLEISVKLTICPHTTPPPASSTDVAHTITAITIHELARYKMNNEISRKFCVANENAPL